MLQKLLSVRLVALLLAAAPAAFAQTGVTIGAATAPDVSAALDIVSSSKGALLPRVAAATAIATPATGLLVFQTGAPAGFYYNAGTPAAPGWQQIATAAGAAITADNGLTKTGSVIGLGGTLTGATTIANAGFNLNVTGPGNVGIGTSNPLTRLSLSPNATEAKITLYDGGSTTDHYGFGISGGQLNYHVDGTSSSHVFSAQGKNGNGIELLRIQGTGNVGIGTPAPSQKLEVAGQVFSSTGGFRFPDNTVQTTAASTVPAATATNGLTKTGNNIGLGGTLSQATAIAQAGNSFSLFNSGFGAAAIDQQQLAVNATTGSTDQWQSFTASASGNLTQLDLLVSSPNVSFGQPGVLNIYAGVGVSGTNLASQSIFFANVSSTYQPFALNAPVAVVAGQQYTYRIGTFSVATNFVSISTANPYAGGQSSYSATSDLCFKTYVAPTAFTNVLAALPTGNVGIGTASPGQRLEVAGQVFSSTGGFRFPDNTVQTTAAATTASNGLTKTGNNIGLGGTLSQATAIDQGGNSFSLTGNGINAAALDQQQATLGGSSGGTDFWQSFTAGVSGLLTQVDFYGSSPVSGSSAGATLSIYAGQGTGGTQLTSQAITLNNVFGQFQPYPLSAPVAVVAGQQYTYRIQTPTTDICCYIYFASGNPYAGGRASSSATEDYGFKTYVSATTTVLTALASGNVGIGTTGPTQALEVAGEVFSNAGGFRFPDNTVQTTAAATTVSNGLTKTGASIELGGTLSQATTIAQGGNTFSLTGGNVGIGTSSPAGLLTVQSSSSTAAALDQQQLNTTAGLGGSTDSWQSFTAGVSGSLTQIDMRVSSPTGTNGQLGTLSIYAGQGTGGTQLTTQGIIYNVNTAYQAYPLSAPVAVVAGQQYTYRFQAPTYGASGPGTPFISFSGSNPYAGGQASVAASADNCFKTYVSATLTTAVLTALAGGSVGIGTATPGAQLHVAGNMKIDAANTLEFGAGVSKEINAGKIGYNAFASGALDIVGAGTNSTTDRKIKFWAEGGAIFTGSVTGVGAYNNSDRRFKQNIRPLGGALASVLALRGVRYEWNALGQQRGGTAGAGQVGLIAQEIEKIYPELVSTGADGYKAVNYAQLTPVLIEALKEQQAQIEALKAEAGAARAEATAAKTQAAQATAATEAFGARLRRLEAAGEGQARR